MLGHTEDAEDGRRNVDVLREPCVIAGRKAGRVHEKRNPYRFLVDGPRVRGRSVLVECLAIVAGDHEDGPIEATCPAEELDEPRHLCVHVRERVPVPILDDFYLLDREFAEAVGKVDGVRGKALREVVRRAIWEVAVLYVQIHEEGTRRFPYPPDRLVDGVAIVDLTGAAVVLGPFGKDGVFRIDD